MSLETAGVPFAKVYSIADIEQDPHFRSRQAIVRLPDPDLGSVPAPCIVPRISGRDMPLPRSGPSVGEHNAEVYAQFGIGPDELAALQAARVI
jgi:crotonobetainyl-CoA:carnitine CoA-transferase CaiB-like acyl-CoA transferase